MSSDNIEIAILCSNAAKDFTENNKDFVIVGTVVKNADVIVSRTDVPKTIGVSQNRFNKLNLVNKRYKDNIKPVFLLNNILPYALEKGEVDAIILDSKNAILLQGDKEGTYNINGDYDSYDMVVNKKFLESNEYREFIETYNESIEDLKYDEKLYEALRLMYKEGEFTERSFDLWKEWNIKLQKLH